MTLMITHHCLTCVAAQAPANATQVQLERCSSGYSIPQGASAREHLRRCVADVRDLSNTKQTRL